MQVLNIDRVAQLVDDLPQNKTVRVRIYINILMKKHYLTFSMQSNKPCGTF